MEAEVGSSKQGRSYLGITFLAFDLSYQEVLYNRKVQSFLGGRFGSRR
jgi:hypothetical protein